MRLGSICSHPEQLVFNLCIGCQRVKYGVVRAPAAAAAAHAPPRLNCKPSLREIKIQSRSEKKKRQSEMTLFEYVPKILNE